MRQRLPDFPGISGPVVIIVMDGYDLPKSDLGSAIEITRAFEEAAFDRFDRVRAPKANLFLMRLELGLRRQLGQLVDVVNRGGDADTTGAIANMLAGALYGPQAIPKRWLKALDPGVASCCGPQARALLPLTA